MNADAGGTAAVLFGSIGTLVETSDLQRRAFNAAFHEAGLPWDWDSTTYRAMLTRPGGRARIEQQAALYGREVDAAALHRRKTQIFSAMVDSLDLPLRRGVADTMSAARDAGMLLGLVSTTAIETIERLLDASHPPLALGAFDLVMSAADVACPKPSPEVWCKALARLGLPAGRAVAIEDSPESAGSALRAGIRTVAAPGAFHAGREFPDAASIVDPLSPEALGLPMPVELEQSGRLG
ncbi:MAG: HAD-IA family hydrolase [Pseudomonadota bacterium]